MKRQSMLDGLTRQQAAFLKQKPSSKHAIKHTSQQETLVTFTVRMPKSMANALRKTATDRKIANLPPMSQQEIVQAAIKKWMDENQ
jgi:hypothetical protein